MLQVFDNLSSNEDVIISSSTDQGMNLAAVADSILEKCGGSDDSQSALMAELALMNQGTSSFIRRD